MLQLAGLISAFTIYFRTLLVSPLRNSLNNN